jgi:hypothetical protein
LTKRALVMARKKIQSNVPTCGLRWSLDAIEREFDISEKTFVKKSAAAGERRGDDGCYSTEQIARSIFTKKWRAQLSKLTAERTKAELDLSKATKTIVETDLATALVEALSDEVRRIVQGSLLSEQDKADCMRQLEGINHKVSAIAQRDAVTLPEPKE